MSMAVKQAQAQEQKAGKVGQWLRLRAVDTWMFRDGRPFGQDDPGAARASSVFPPFPPTLVGAVRALLWRQVLNGHWDESLLGDGSNWQRGDSLGKLSFGPPVVLYDEKPLFPVPQHILAKERAEALPSLTCLLPRKETCNSDLGERRLPAKQSDLPGAKPVTDYWLTLTGMKQVLRGEVPNPKQLVKLQGLWRHEERVGIGIMSQQRITRDGNLYMAQHVRMHPAVALAVQVRGWQGDWPQALHAFGGEHRMAEIDIMEQAELLPEDTAASAANDGERTCMLIAISPVAPDRNGNIRGLRKEDGVEVISACLGKPVGIGGWDVHARAPVPMRRCWPAGSVWFVRLKEDAPPPTTLGEATNWGFGHVLVGVWQDS